MGATALLLFVSALWSANQAMAQWFFADFHNESAKWHESLGNRFALFAVLLSLGFLYSLRLLTKEKKRGVTDTVTPR
ncbi:MAG TPA: hypothetical protein VMI32_17940 [Candidatus Solibacter sp.]|nr:hypothetical protein [Candidatus Solibacter sp.]